MNSKDFGMSFYTSKYVPSREFWDTMKIMVERDWNRNVKEDVQDWLDKVIPKRYVEFSENQLDSIEMSISFNTDDHLRKRMLPFDDSEDSNLLDDIKKFLKDIKPPKIDCKYVFYVACVLFA